MRKGQKPSLLVVAFAIIFSTFSTQAQHSAKGKTAETTTLSLLQMHSAYQQASGEQKRQTLSQFRAIAAQRQQVLSSLIQTDPADVLRIAIPNDIRGKMPSSVQSFVEQTVTTQGTAEVSIEDSKTGSKIHYGLNTAAGKFTLHFAGEEPTNLLTGSVIKVSGIQVGSDLALACCSDSPSGTVQTVAGVLPNTFGAQNTLVILVNFQDNTSQPWTAAAVQSMVFTTASNFWLENSFQQTWITGDVAGWFTLPISSSTCDVTSIQSYAQQAAQNAGFALSNYTRFLYVFPQTSACGWQGYSYIGGTPSNSFINGSLEQQIVSHELGHALGLYHSHSLSCGTAVYASTGCTQYEYGDSYDSMANSNVNGYGYDYNSFQKERLGWLNYSSEPPISTISSSGSYTIAPIETQDANSKALKILQSGSSNTYYYVELRQATGADQYLSLPVTGYSEILEGVVVHAASPSNANSSDLLDMNPALSWGSAMALDAGQSYSDATAGITITPTAVSSTGATVQVTLTGPTCSPANPVVSISPSQSQYVTAGTPVNFAPTVTDKDSSVCAPATFSLSDALPAGFSGSWSAATTVSLSPGASGTATVTVTSPAGTADGFYNVVVNAANASSNSYSSSATATYVISTPTPAPPSPTVSVSTNQSSYLPGQTVLITATVRSGTSPDAGAGVSVTVAAPGGKVTTLSGTTGSNGVASLSYKLSKRAAAGTYSVQVGPSITGASATASASTSFVVQ